MYKKLLVTAVVSLLVAAISLTMTPAQGADPVPGNGTGTPPAIPAIGNSSSPSGYKLVWGDDFDGNDVDTTKWNVFNASNFGAGNKEDQCYMAANAAVSDGKLHLTAKKETVACTGTNPDTKTKTYYVTSGALTTMTQDTQPETFKFAKGYVETSVRLPKGNAFWGAFWLVGSTTSPVWPNYGEFDVFEQPGGYGDLTAQGMHYSCNGGAHCSTTTSPYYNLATASASSLADNMGTQVSSANYDTYDGLTTSTYVRYGFLWEPGRITWYVNGRPVRSFDGTNLTTYTTDADGNVIASEIPASVGTGLSGVEPSMDTVTSYEHTLLLNLAVGGGFPKWYGYTGGETPTGYDDGNRVGPEPAVMDVDYVHVYQLDDAPVTDPPPDPPIDPGPPVDTTNPTVSFTAPASGASAQGDVAITADATDDVAVTKVDVSVDGTLFQSDTDAADGWGAVWNTVAVPAGAHALTLTAYDAAGNHTSVTQPVTVTKPVPAPTISSFGASPVSFLAGLSSTLKWIRANAVSCAVSPGGPTATTATSWTTPLQLTTGRITYTLTCKNSVGATVSKTTSLTVNKATRAPTSVVLTPSIRTVTSGTKVTFRWTSSGSTRCSVTPGGSTVYGTGGSTTLAVTKTTTYRAACVNAAGTTYSTGQTVTVRR